MKHSRALDLDKTDLTVSYYRELRKPSLAHWNSRLSHPVKESLFFDMSTQLPAAVKSPFRRRDFAENVSFDAGSLAPEALIVSASVRSSLRLSLLGAESPVA